LEDGIAGFHWPLTVSSQSKRGRSRYSQQEIGKKTGSNFQVTPFCGNENPALLSHNFSGMTK
jgi:hypothetical protein